MRPYLAIIRDSFRAAFASRVLYVLLGLICLLLLVVCPLHIREALDWKLGYQQHFTNPQAVAEQLVNRGESDDYPEVQRIWSQLSEEVRKSMRSVLESDENASDSNSEDEDSKPGNERRRRPPNAEIREMSALINELNDLISDQEFYRAEDWEQVTLPAEAQALVDEGVENLSLERSRRLNRLLVGKAIPAIQPGAPTTMTVYYALFTWPDDAWSFSSTRSQVSSVMISVTTYILDKFVLSIGLLIGILVTANIIPETFEPGSLNLLLSKPISRWGLFLTKFFGGCVLIAICAVTLFFGIWLWLGLGFSTWDRAILWSIPLYILVFAIYFSVSAFVGLVYRSPIMAVVVTGLFWAVCYVVGSGYGFLNARMANERKYDPVIMEGHEPYAYDGLGNPVQWEPDEGLWNVEVKNSFREKNSPEAQALDATLVAAVWMEKLKEEPFRLPPVTDGTGRTYVGANHILNVAGRTRQAFLSSQGPGEPLINYGKYPRDAVAQFPLESGLLVVSSFGTFFQLDPNDLVEPGSNAGDLASPAAGSRSESGAGQEPESVKPFDVAGVFEEVGPNAPIRVNRHDSVDYNPESEEVVIHLNQNQSHSLHVFRREGQRFVEDRSVEFEIGSTARINCFVACGGNRILVVAGNGQVILFDSKTLKEIRGYRAETRFGIEQLHASSDGRWFGLLYGNQRLWLLDTENDEQLSLASVRGQGSISSLTFDQKNRLCVMDREDRLTCYDLETSTAEDTYSASNSWLSWSYRYILKPIYWVFPKPSEFYKVVSYLSTSNNAADNSDVDLIGTKVTVTDPLAPLWTGLGFMCTMLMLSCLVFQYKDF